MHPNWYPMRWPASWRVPAALDLLQGSPFNCLLIEAGPVAEEARRRGLGVMPAPPDGVRVVQGEWPGIHMASAHGAQASAGPTGVPWLDSNGWRVRLERATHPGCPIWIDAAPKKDSLVSPDAFLTAFSDAAAFGGRWIVSLDERTAAGIQAGNARSLEAWRRLAAAARFFDSHKSWADYAPMGLLGVLSDFSGANAFLAGETLNLLARANQQYQVIRKDAVSPDWWQGLRAVLYVDAQPPSAELRAQLEALVYDGRMLIAGPQWGRAPGTPAQDQEYPRYEVRLHGKGKLAIAKAEPDDPYVLAQDAVLLLSHRYELLRFFNVGAAGSCLAAAPDGNGALLQMLFYASRGPRDASVWVAGRYTAARLWDLENAASRPLEVRPVRGGVELHLPPLAQYAAVELESRGR